MYRVIDKKDTGKTRKLLTECAKNKGAYVCRHPNRVSDKCLAYGIPLVDAYGFDEIKSIPSNKPLYIDELELFVQFSLNNLAGYALSEED